MEDFENHYAFEPQLTASLVEYLQRKPYNEVAALLSRMNGIKTFKQLEEEFAKRMEAVADT